jgi:Fascin domain-containing protein
VKWVILRTSDGRFVSGRNTYQLPVLAGEIGDMFELHSLGTGKVALRAISTGRYLSAPPEGLCAAADEIGDTEMFTTIQGEDGRIALGLAGGGFVSAPAGGEVRLAANSAAEAPADTEWFSVQE